MGYLNKSKPHKFKDRRLRMLWPDARVLNFEIGAQKFTSTCCACKHPFDSHEPVVNMTIELDTFPTSWYVDEHELEHSEPPYQVVISLCTNHDACALRTMAE